MKRLFFSLLVAGIALGGSAFTNVDSIQHVKGGKSISSAFLVQPTNGTYRQSTTGSGTCGTPVTNPCKYQVQTPNSIPDQATYDLDDIQDYVAAGWLIPTSDGNRIYTGS